MSDSVRNRIILAFDSFKDCMSADEACESAALGISGLNLPYEISSLPLSDGGEGLLQVLKHSKVFADACVYEVLCHDAYFNEFKAPILIKNDTAVIECAAVVGIERARTLGLNFAKGTSYGLGECISFALDKGVHHIIIGLGGSATNDGGAGMAQALGVAFYDKDGALIKSPLRVEDLNRIFKADITNLDGRLDNCAFEASCDVNTVLLGRRGATVVFGPQKGADDGQLHRAELGLMAYAGAMSAAFKKPAVAAVAGSGAAGGLGAGCIFVLNAALHSGIDVILDLNEFDHLLDDSCLVITGEGRSDSQSACGKVPAGVIKRCVAHGVKCVVVSGALGDGADRLEQLGACGVFAITREAVDLKQALADGPVNLSKQVRNIVRMLYIAKGI